MIFDNKSQRTIKRKCKELNLPIPANGKLPANHMPVVYYRFKGDTVNDFRYFK